MNKIGITLLMVFNFYNVTFSQVKDTIFYNEYWNESVKKYAHYFRPLPVKSKGDLFIIKDYYINGNIQMKTFSKNKSGTPFEGKVVWFYENGTKMLEKEYDNGKLIGKDKSYFKDGTLMTSSEFSNGKYFDGTFYSSQKSEFKTATYKKGKVVSKNAYYQKSKKIALKKLYNKGKEEINFVFFNEKGNTLFVGNDSYINLYYNGLIKVCYTLSKDKNINDVEYLIYQKVINNELQRTVKDKEGKIIAKGIYKDKRPFKGQFLEKKQLLNYKDGIKDGEVIFYDDNYKEVSRGFYKNSNKFSGDFYESYSKIIKTFKEGKVIAEQTKNKFTGEIYNCTFDNYKALDGTVFNYNTLKTYKGGRIIREIDYDSSFGDEKVIIYYDTERDYQINKKIFFEGNNEYTVTYKNGIAYNGKEINSYGFITHKEGKVTGPFLIKDNKVTVSGNYKNFRKEGEIKYVLKNNDIYTCFYKDGKPVNGTAFEFYSFISYKNSKKEGCAYKTYNNRSYAYDSLKICYKEDIPVGMAKYYHKKALLTNATYKKGKPFDGVFYDKKNKKVYKKGQLIEQDFSFLRKYTTQQFLNTNNQITKEIVKDYYKDTVVYTTLYKNGLPFKGVQVAYDTLGKLYKKTNYESGKKEGEQKLYENFNNSFVKKYTYKNDIKEGVAQFHASFSDSIFKGTFKKGKAFTGTFINDNNVFKSKTRLNRGDTISVSYYDKYGRNLITSIQYKKGKPFEGILLKKVDNSNKNAQKYIKGNLVLSYSRPSRFVNSKEPAYYRSKTYHNNLKDSIIMKGEFENNFSSILLDYASKSKETGIVKYYKNKELVGEGSFKSNEITSFKYKSTIMYFENFSIEFLNKSLHYNFSYKEYRFEFSSEVKNITKQKNIYFQDLLKVGSNINSDVKLFVDDKLLSVVTEKYGQPYNGVLFNLEKDNSYKVILFKKGKQSEVFKGFTKQELLDRMEEFKLKVESD